MLFGEILPYLIVCAMLLIPIVLAVYLLWKRKWQVFFIFATVLVAILLLFWLLLTAIVRDMSRSAPERTPAEFVGHWVGSFGHLADSKPTLPAGTVHEIVLREDGTCHVRGFLQMGSPVWMYDGDGLWRIEKNPKVAYDIVVTLTLDGVQHENRLWIGWQRLNGKWQWSLSWPWFDPDCRDPNMKNDLRFIKVASAEGDK